MNESIKAKKVKFVNPNVLIGAVDISKDNITGYLQGPQGQEVKPFEFGNDFHGISQFLFKAITTKNKYGTKRIIVGFESTGPYGEPFRNFMKAKKGIELVQVNPVHTKRMKEIIDNSPGKTDKKDPRVIASLIRLGHTLSLIIPEGIAAELRELVWSRERRIKERTACINMLESLMFRIFPELVRIFKKVSSKTALYLIERYPTPDSLKELTLGELSKMLRKVSRGRVREDKARRLLWGANNSLGTREGLSSIIKEINYLVSQIKRINESVDEAEKEIKDYLEEIPHAKRLLLMKGIGHITVGGIIGEVADFNSFSTQSEIIKLAGLDLYEISSGRHNGIKRISKRGRPLLRKLLYFAALNTVRKGGIFHDYYQGFLKRGKEKPKALIAVAKKLLKVIFAMVRDGTNYIENHKPDSKELKKVA